MANIPEVSEEFRRGYELARERITELEEALRVADKEASVAHDAIWAQEVTSASILHDNERPDSAQSAIWRLHTVVRRSLTPTE